jgi:translation initiation factor 1
LSRDDDRLVYSSEHGEVGDRRAGRRAGKRDRKERSGGGGPTDPRDGVARVRRDRKGRRGKTVTTVTGVEAPEEELRALVGELKRRCGSGGALVDGVIEIQGDHVDTLVAELEKRGLRAKRAGG